MPLIVTASTRASIIVVALALGTAACSGATNTASAAPTDAKAVSANYEAAGTSSAAPAPAPDAPAPAPNEWQGIYTYAFNGGANAAGTGTVVTYTLAVSPSTCRLTAEGYQTDETIICTTKPIPNGIDVAFKSYGDGHLTDKYDNAVYSVDDPLFSLERNNGAVLTHWKGYPLPDEKPHPVGVYFKN